MIPIAAYQLDTVSNTLHTLVMSSERPTLPIPAFNPMDAYRAAAERNAKSVPARGVPFAGCERPTVPAPKPPSRAARIKELMVDEGMTRRQAAAMVDY